MYICIYVYWKPLCAYLGASVSHKCWFAHIYSFYIVDVVLTDWLAYYNFINIQTRIYCIFFFFIFSLSSFPRLLFFSLLFCCVRCQVQCQIIDENINVLHVLGFSYDSVLPRCCNNDNIDAPGMMCKRRSCGGNALDIFSGNNDEV